MTNIIEINPEWLKYQRVKSRYTINYISQYMDVPSLMVESWEHSGLIEYQYIIDISKLYNVSALYFLNENNPHWFKKLVYTLLYILKKKE